MQFIPFFQIFCDSTIATTIKSFVKNFIVIAIGHSRKKVSKILQYYFKLFFFIISRKKEKSINIIQCLCLLLIQKFRIARECTQQYDYLIFLKKSQKEKEDKPIVYLLFFYFLFIVANNEILPANRLIVIKRRLSRAISWKFPICWNTPSVSINIIKMNINAHRYLILLILSFLLSISFV